ncbi:PDZ domain-containing protein [Mesobacillus maritimus]|uniref:SepM family pheromone-processing serine protease n=1 Tax=Mesobacillus maritimus TaxID=1643336 RepID=UPI0020421D1A|nr:SepM family pheromone-processing serine protease [Mesobacillus maritimus]MCM3667638.1 PDZ domain-containing protein [Mesobacillus maritimus]
MRKIQLLLIFTILLFASSFYYLPYYVSKPGMAKELEPIIEVDGGYDEEGSFMLTTIRMGRANVYAYILAKLDEYSEIHPVEDIRAENETDEEYTMRQLHMMDTSKTSAIEVAYKKAGLPIEYDYKGVYVLQVIPGMPAEGKLTVGDRIIEIDGQRFSSSKEFIDYVSSKQEGDQLTFTAETDGSKREVDIKLQKFDETSERVGIGISLVDDKEIKVQPSIEMDTDEIGGPSAGLMFSLEIYNQLSKTDLTKGYAIAGTGTISTDGTVGRIGGIEQKIVAADKAGADYFLAPNEEGAADSNYQIALKTAKDIKTSMEIIPVNTFDDAVEFLENLPAKTS